MSQQVEKGEDQEMEGEPSSFQSPDKQELSDQAKKPEQIDVIPQVNDNSEMQDESKSGVEEKAQQEEQMPLNSDNVAQEPEQMVQAHEQMIQASQQMMAQHSED